MFAEAMRETLSFSMESLRKIGEKSGIAYSTIHGFKSGKRDLKCDTLSKIFESLSEEDAESFMTRLDVKRGLLRLKAQEEEYLKKINERRERRQKTF